MNFVLYCDVTEQFGPTANAHHHYTGYCCKPFVLTVV